jgi:hypothetical protein
MSITKALLYTAVLASMATPLADANAFLVKAASSCTCSCMYPGQGGALPAYALAPDPEVLAEYYETGNDALLAYDAAPNPTCKAINGTACKGWSGSAAGGTLVLQNGTFQGCM